jgi:hypothetical protein
MLVGIVNMCGELMPVPSIVGLGGRLGKDRPYELTGGDGDEVGAGPNG